MVVHFFALEEFDFNYTELSFLSNCTFCAQTGHIGVYKSNRPIEVLRKNATSKSMAIKGLFTFIT